VVSAVDNDVVQVNFDDGQLVSAESSAQRLDTRLGTVLVKTRRLSPENLARALELQAQTLQRLGHVLLKNNFCSPQDLRDGLDIQIRQGTNTDDFMLVGRLASNSSQDAQDS